MGITCPDTAQEMSDVGQLGKSSRVERPRALASPAGTAVAMCHPSRGLATLTFCCSPYR